MMPNNTARALLFLCAAVSLSTPFIPELLPSPARAEGASVPGLDVEVGPANAGYYISPYAEVGEQPDSGAKDAPKHADTRQSSFIDKQIAGVSFMIDTPALEPEVDCPQTWLGYMRIARGLGCHAVWCPKCWASELKSSAAKRRHTVDAAVFKWPE